MDRASGPEGGHPDIPPARAALPLMLTLSGAALAQSPPVTIDANIPPPTTFTHHLPFAHLPEGIRSVAFAPDRDVIYVHYTTPVIDAWALAVSYWPELLGGFLLLWTLLALALAWRVKRRPQSPSAPHCRRCNYDLSPQVARREGDNATFEVATDARCPECGVALSKHRPRRGRTLRRRLAPVLVLWLIPAAAYSSMHLARLPRQGFASNWFDASSSSLASWSKSRSIKWLAPRVKQGDEVVEVDLPSGTVTRTVTTRRSTTHSQLVVTPDGSGLILSGDDYGQLQLVSTRTGRRLAQATIPGNDRPMGSRWRSVVGFSPVGVTAFVQWCVRETATSGVSAWDLSTGNVTTVAQTPSHVDFRGPQAFAHGRPFLLRAADPPKLVSFPSFMEAFPTGTFVLRYHPTPAANLQDDAFALDPTPNPTQDPAITSDGRRVFLTSRYGESILAVDLADREVVGSLSAGRAIRFAFGICLSKDDRYLAACTGSGVLVRDTEQKRWTASLHHPTSLYGGNPDVSPGNRWLAAVLQTGTTTFRHELVLWNLAEILESSEHAQPTEPTP